MLRYLLIFLAIVAIAALLTMQFRGPTITGFDTVSEYTVDGNAEIIQAAGGGNFLVHTNSERRSIDVVDITDPDNPSRVSRIEMPGEPTSVGVSPDGNWAFAVVYISESKTGEAPKDLRLPGLMMLIDLRDPVNAAISATMGIGHHPDSIAVTSAGDELFAIIAIENEPVVVRDGKVTAEDAPGNDADISNPGRIQIIAIDPAKPERYTVTNVGLPEELLHNKLMLFATDPQPEFVAISPGKHLAAISLQENNGIVLLDPASGEVVGAFSLGSVATRPADLINDKQVLLQQSYPDDANTESLAGTRFPDAISFTPDGQYLLSADEGELALTGGRGFSIWDLEGQFIWDDGGEIERRAAAMDLYDDSRSDSKGIEVEGITAARYGARDYAFALSERGSFVAIYDISNPRAPVFEKIIPVGKAPESAVTIPERDLLVVAAEKSGKLTFIRHVAAE